MSFILGRRYSRKDINKVLGGETVTYLPQTAGKIVCGCFERGMNTSAPEEVQVGNAPRVTEKAELLADQLDKRIPVFMKVACEGPRWEYYGVYEFVELTDDEEAIDAAEEQSGRYGELSYVLRLKRVSD